MKMIYILLATLFCIITFGIIDVEIKYSDGTKFKYISWIHIFYKKDYEKVVRCKDCNYQDYCLQKVDCEYLNREIFYCSYGERK